jgi:hypothetical protein
MTKITTLYTKFEKALAAVDKTAKGDEDNFDAVIDKASDIADRIVEAPADPKNPIPDMLMKIAAHGWLNGALPPFDRWTECDFDNRCLVSIRADLQMMMIQAR